MSTKTTFKRIALATVAAMGFGLLSVAPAQAATGAATITRATAILYTTGAAVTNVISLQTAGTDPLLAGSVTATVTTKPVGSVSTPTFTSTGIAAPFALAPSATQYGMSYSGATATIAAATGTGANTNAAASALGTVSFTPDVPCRYLITVAATQVGSSASVDATYVVYMSGTALTVAQTGVGTTSGVGVAGGQVSFAYTTVNGVTNPTKFNVTVTGGNLVSGSGLKTDGTTTNNPTNINGTTAADGLTFTVDQTTSGVYTFIAAIPTAGTFTATISSINTSTGVPSVAGRISVTVTATASSSVSAPLSSAFIGTGQAACSTADATASALRFSSALGTAAANICVTLRDINGAAINGQSLSVTISGPGLVTAEANHSGTVAAGTARVAALTATEMASSHVAQIGINADGTDGVSTISIFAGTTLIATKTLTFYGDVATLTATQNYAIARSGITAATLATTATANLLGSTTSADTGLTVATSPAVTIVAKDASGNVVPGITVTAVIADATVLSSVEIAEAAGAASTIGAAGRGTFLAAVRSAIGGVSGKSTTVTFRTPDPATAGAFITTAPVTFTLGGTKTGGTVTITTNKEKY